MDIDATYEMLKSAMDKLEIALSDPSVPREEALEAAVDGWAALDGWLARGGYPPRAWKKMQDEAIKSYLQDQHMLGYGGPL